MIAKTTNYLCVIMCLLHIYSCDFFAVGSYPFAEYYSFKTYSKESLIKRINIFKDNNPEYEMPGESWDHDSNSGYLAYFYFPDKDITLLCVIKDDGLNPVKLGFESYSNGTNGGTFYRINKDIKKSESAELKKKFETEILNQIGGWSRR